MKYQEIKTVFELIGISLVPPCLYVISINLANLTLGTESFNLVGDFFSGVAASILFVIVMIIHDLVIRIRKIDGIKEVILTLVAGVLPIFCLTFLLYQEEKQAIINSCVYTILSLGYAYIIKERYENLSDS